MVVRVLQSLFLVIVSLIVLAGAFGLGIGTGYFAYLVEDTELPSKETMNQELGNLSQTSLLTYADDTAIATVNSDLQRKTVASDQISDLLKKAIVSTEDENFYEHQGYVPKAVIRALVSEVTGIGSSGGSTLTQQLVKQQMLTDETTFKRKANEIILAHLVDKNFSKDEILTMYLNVSPFGRNNKGENIAGVQEAAKGIFGVDASKLNLAQAAFIAGLPQSPISYSPYNSDGSIKDDVSLGLKRKDFVLFSMYRNNAITKKEYEEAKAYDLKSDFLPQAAANTNEQSFLYYAVMDEAKSVLGKQLAEEAKISEKEYAKDEVKEAYETLAEQKIINGGYTIHSTIDKTIYQAMQDAAATYGYQLDDGNGTVEVGNVLMNNQTGRIIGFVGGRDFSTNQFNHAFSAERQAGSAIKPALVYAPAIDLGLIGTETRVSNYATTWGGTSSDSDEQVVNATQYNMNTFQTVREAISWSNNIPAYQIYQNTLNKEGSTSYVYDNYLAKMNYPDVDQWTYPSAPLGVVDLTVLEQTSGFQTLANGGVYQDAYMISSITDSSGHTIYEHEEDPVQVYSKATASIMNDLMRSVLTSNITSKYKPLLTALNSTLGNADWVGKTGTTNDYKDSWLVVSTPSITLSSWTGHDDGTASDEGASLRQATYMANLANAIYQSSPDTIGVTKKFTLDSSVKKEKVNTFTGEKNVKTVTFNGTTYTLPTATTTSYWAKSAVSDSQFKFGIGGTDSNYLSAWQKGATSTKK
ncbi:peptidase [Enterococcus italicus DSM 15952]|nr:peptidase [Enterococcus italicus DSM 15952]